MTTNIFVKRRVIINELKSIDEIMTSLSLRIQYDFEFCENNIAIIHCCKNLEFERIDFFVIISILLIENDNVFSMRIDLMSTWWNFDTKRTQMWFFSYFFDIRKFCFRVSKILISVEKLHAIEKNVQIAIFYKNCNKFFFYQWLLNFFFWFYVRTIQLNDESNVHIK